MSCFGTLSLSLSPLESLSEKFHRYSRLRFDRNPDQPWCASIRRLTRTPGKKLSGEEPQPARSVFFLAGYVLFVRNIFICLSCSCSRCCSSRVTSFAISRRRSCRGCTNISVRHEHGTTKAEEAGTLEGGRQHGIVPGQTSAVPQDSYFQVITQEHDRVGQTPDDDNTCCSSLALFVAAVENLEKMVSFDGKISRDPRHAYPAPSSSHEGTPSSHRWGISALLTHLCFLPPGAHYGGSVILVVRVQGCLTTSTNLWTKGPSWRSWRRSTPTLRSVRAGDWTARTRKKFRKTWRKK